MAKITKKEYVEALMSKVSLINYGKRRSYGWSHEKALNIPEREEMRK